MDVNLKMETLCCTQSWVMRGRIGLAAGMERQKTDAVVEIARSFSGTLIKRGGWRGFMGVNDLILLIGLLHKY